MTTHINMLRHEVIALLSEHDVGRLCVFDGEFPIAFPVNYRLVRIEQGHVVVVQTGSNTTIARAEGPASLEVDRIEPADGSVWSVIARGDLRQVHGDHGLPSTDPLVATGRDQWVRLRITAMSGRRFKLATQANSDRDLRP